MVFFSTEFILLDFGELAAESRLVQIIKFPIEGVLFILMYLISKTKKFLLCKGCTRKLIRRKTNQVLYSILLTRDADRDLYNISQIWIRMERYDSGSGSRTYRIGTVNLQKHAKAKKYIILKLNFG